MKIILTAKEYKQVTTLMNVVEAGSAEIAEVRFNASPLVKAGLHGDSYEIEVDSEYMTEFLSAVTESSVVIVPLVKTIIGMGQALAEKLEGIVRKHMGRQIKTAKQAAVDQGMESAKNVEQVICELSMSVDREKVKSFDDLEDNCQHMLLSIYGTSVVEMFNDMLNGNYPYFGSPVSPF